MSECEWIIQRYPIIHTIFLSFFLSLSLSLILPLYIYLSLSHHKPNTPTHTHTHSHTLSHFHTHPTYPTLSDTNHLPFKLMWYQLYSVIFHSISIHPSFTKQFPSCSLVHLSEHFTFSSFLFSLPPPTPPITPSFLCFFVFLSSPCWLYSFFFLRYYGPFPFLLFSPSLLPI